VADIFDEIREDLRTEQALRLFRRYGWLIIVAAVLVIVGVVGWQFYQRQRDQRDSDAAAAYVAAMNTVQDSPSGIPQKTQIPVFDNLTTPATPEAYRTLARLQAAGLKAANGDLAGAETTWGQVSADPDADSVLRDFAILMMAQHELDHGDPAQLQARLKPLSQANGPWSALAREQLAVLDLRLGKTDDARNQLRALSMDFLAPSGLRARVSALLASLGSPGTTH
jgi:hypothetical protein